MIGSLGHVTTIRSRLSLFGLCIKNNFLKELHHRPEYWNGYLTPKQDRAD
jgi:hypothetical protein